ncbi:hypothetical protein Val02_13150 [Virgisporangium aliadipatigenens]|uniref:MFS transporter n=1 Tax=Virgisporangium aliadipatigenens TaxID=741659 RepID=A0A8J3YFU3_9ACTN|nr:MFS transporter [Virgisporangium aliadipatigenens]GIJ44429.1 hypothetical protein Val02_13150 [Virgisporangium aliadipatigenens]
MAFIQVVGQVLGALAYALLNLAKGSAVVGRHLGKGVRGLRTRGGAGEPGMIRLLDLHAASIAGDALVAIGLAGTIFFSVPAGEARGNVALYLVVTMLPFAVLAPVVGPVLDRFRHGRRYALATTFLGRAFLAYMISENIDGIALYPAAFGVLVLSRAYGVARSAAVPRLLPAKLGLSEANARASVFGTLAGAVIAPVGVAAAAWGGQAWPLRIALLVFLYGMVTALRLPPRADSDPPERVPRPMQLRGPKGAKVLSAPLVVATLIGSGTLRALYGFLALYVAFSVREGHLDRTVLGADVKETAAIGLLAGALGVGSFLGTAVGTSVRIRRPLLLQAGAIVAAALVAVVAARWYTLPAVLLVCLVAAAGSGLAKLTVDAVIQERTGDETRATAFAHAETLLMIAWVTGGGLGLIPFGGRWGMLVAAAVLVLGALRAVWVAGRLRKERLTGASVEPETTVDLTKDEPPPTLELPAGPGDEPTVIEGEITTPARETPAGTTPEKPRRRWLRRPKRAAEVIEHEKAEPAEEPTRVAVPTARAPERLVPEVADPRGPAPTRRLPADPGRLDEPDDDESPGFHLYRPSSLPEEER